MLVASQVALVSVVSHCARLGSSQREEVNYDLWNGQVCSQ